MTSFMTTFSNEITQLLTANAKLLEETTDDSINVKTIEAREGFITQLTTIAGLLPDITAQLTTALTKAKAAHTKDISTVGSLVDKLRRRTRGEVPEASGQWRTVGKRNGSRASGPGQARGLPLTPARSIYLSINGPRASGDAARAAHDGGPDTTDCLPLPLAPPRSPDARALPRAKVKITEALYLQAVKVSIFDYVKQDGQLYYVETADHFAIKIAGRLLHGNIGVIYTEEKNPEKIKDCRFAESCIKRDKCDYYHDPLRFTGSRDHRNFIASSWLYAPPNGQYKNRPKSRRFGSRDHLDIDIVGLQEDEISRFYDQTMHDLLCSLLLDQTSAVK